MIRRIVDFCYYARKWIIRRLVHVCMLLYGTELSYKHVCNGAYDAIVHVDRNLDEAKDIDTLLTVAKDCWTSAVERRKGVTDKCKTLLSISRFAAGTLRFSSARGIFARTTLDADTFLLRRADVAEPP